MILLGIDPGTRYAGYAIVTKEKQRVSLLNYGVLNMTKTKDLVERIGIFYDFFSSKIEEWNVTNLAIETPYFGLNAATFGKLSFLRGILYLLTRDNKLVLSEFSPADVKKGATGYGSASKEQVSNVILKLFPSIKLPSKSDDITDALAVSLCGIWSSNNKKERSGQKAKRR